MRQNRYHNTANSSNAAVITGNGVITIGGSIGEQGTFTVNVNDVSLNAKMAEALVSCYLTEKADGALLSKSFISTHFCNKIKNAQEIEAFKKNISVYLFQIGQDPEGSDQIIQYLQNYIYSSNLFEVLGVAKQLPNDNAVSIFNKDISHNVLSYLTTNDINYNTDNPTVVIAGNSTEEGDAAQEAPFPLHSTK